MVLCNPSVVFLLASQGLGVSWAWHQSNTVMPRRQSTLISVASRDVEQETESIPYAVARGDGSTGGGGLPMPNAETDDGLTRPKVGAAMPEG
jgi:hypothetical protein